MQDFLVLKPKCWMVAWVLLGGRAAFHPSPSRSSSRACAPPKSRAMVPYQPAGRLQHTWHGLEEKDGASDPIPSELNTMDHSRFAAVSKDKMTVRYTGRGNHSQDVGAVRTNWPCPHRCFVYYYEVSVIDAGTRGSIGVGLADPSFDLNRQPGWEPNSYAYHGHDGRRYVDSERGEPYGPRFGAGDVIGCGLLTDHREIFFTKNGALLGMAFSEITTTVHPTVGLHSPGEKVTFNLGGAPFVFDVDAFANSQREARLSPIRTSLLPADVDLEALVKGYLLHYNYEQTLAKLDVASPSIIASAAGASSDARNARSPPESSYATCSSTSSGSAVCASTSTSSGAGAVDIVDGFLPEGLPLPALQKSSECSRQLAPTGVAKGYIPHAAPLQVAGPSAVEAALRTTMRARRELWQHLLRGDALRAAGCTECHFPGLLARHPYVQFRLRCQHFIELLRVGEPMEAVAYARAELARYQPPHGTPPTQEAARELEEVFSLVAYRVPGSADGNSAAPSHFMSVMYREATASCLNSAVLLEHGVPPHCAIHRLLRHLLVVNRAMRDANLGYGPDVDFEEWNDTSGSTSRREQERGGVGINVDRM